MISRQQLVDALNEDLAYEYQAVIMYIKYSAAVSGPHRLTLAGFFGGEVGDEIGHAKYLAQKVATLGGNPVSEPKRVPEATSPHEMLQNVLEAESSAIKRYVQHADLAGQLGEHAIRLQLELFLQEETDHKQEVEQVLIGWKD